MPWRSRPPACWPGGPPRRTTTHYDELAELDPSILVDTEARYVDDGDVVTSAGVSAGIDMALHLVDTARDDGGGAVPCGRAIQHDGRLRTAYRIHT